MNTTTRPTQALHFEFNGVTRSFHYPGDQHLTPFVKAVLSGEDYPLVFPGLFQAKTIVDIGAHAGAASIYLKANYPDAEIFAFEPCKESFDLYCRNLQGLSPIIPCHAALGTEEGKAQLFHGEHSSMQQSLKANEENSDNFEWVAVLAADEVFDALQRDSFSIVKMDTEGFELEILHTIFEYLPKTDVIYLEYHSEQDRLAIDQFLSDNFVLYAARATEAHRGTNT
ncbi:MAG: FkbM family methyltransferase, partial [Planctomycetota bacterium]